MHGSDHILPTDGTLIHALAALGAGDHVTALQQDTVNGRVHADPAQVLLHAGRHCSTWQGRGAVGRGDNAGGSRGTERRGMLRVC